MRILVTGSDGQLGKCLQDVLLNTENQIYFATRFHVDIVDREQVTKVFEDFKPELVINAAAYTAVDKAEEEVDKAFLVNQTACRYLAKACTKLSIPIIHVSTDYVFDGQATAPYTENSQTNPQGVYARSKLAGEKEIIRHAEKYCVLRTSWVFSEYGKNFVKTMLRLAESRNELTIVNDQIGCPTYAGDIAESIRVIIENMLANKHENGIYHYANWPACSWFQFADEIFTIAKRKNVVQRSINIKPISTDEYPTKAYRPKYSVLDTSKILKQYAIQIPDWNKGLEKVISKLAKFGDVN